MQLNIFLAPVFRGSVLAFFIPMEREGPRWLNTPETGLRSRIMKFPVAKLQINIAVGF